MKFLTRTRLAVVLIMIQLVPVLATDWPGWRGPNRDGSSTEKELLAQWPEGGPSLSWKATNCGVGFSSVAVVGDRLFTMGDSQESCRVRAFDAQTGNLLWISKAVGQPGGGPPGPRSTPTVDSGNVYVLGQFGDLVCLEAATGKERWRKNLTKDFGGECPGWQYAESVLVDGDKVMATPGGARGAVIALNKNTGELLWQSAQFKDPAHYSSLIVGDLDGARQCIQLTEHSVAGISTSNGALLWRADRNGDTAVVPTPIFKDREVYVTSGYGIGCNAFQITKTAAGFQAGPLYANKTMVNHHGGVILVEDNLYGFSDGKGWVCQNFKTGDLVWAHQGVGKGALAYADGHLYLRSEGAKGTVALIEATPKGYIETGRFDQPDRSGSESWSHPVVVNGRLYLRDQDLLLCYDVKMK